MKIAVKTVGIILIFAGAAFFGFFKSFSKRDYIKKLKKTVLALDKADNMLRLGTNSREKILKISFGGIENELLSDNATRGELRDLINSFFRDFGSGDTQTESARIKRLKKELSEEINREEAEYKASGRLWRTAGVCTGLAFCIMLI